MLDGATARAQVLGQLKTYYAQVAVAVDDAESDYFTPENSIAGWRSALRVYSALILRLEPFGDLGIAAANGGQAQHDFWMSNAKNVSAGLSNINAVMGGARFAWNRFWDEVVVQTAVDVKTTAIQTADAALPHTYALLGLVVVGLIALAVVRVAPLVRS